MREMREMGESGKSRICRPGWCIVVGVPPVLCRQSASPQQSSNKFDSEFGSHDWWRPRRKTGNLLYHNRIESFVVAVVTGAPPSIGIASAKFK